MADSILRLQVESQEYDAKLKRATEGLQRYVDGCRKVGGTLEVVEKDTLDYVKAIGQMETVSRSATGKLSEMKRAFTELSMQYRQMTNAERQSPMGKALSQSLDQLNGRIAETKRQMDEVSRDMNGGGGLGAAMDALAGKFGLNINQLAGWGAAIAAAAGSAKIARDAFFQMESNIDEWGRITQSSGAVYETFLDTLNGGDWSNFFNNLSTAVRGARDLYDALDRVGSVKANNKAAIAITQLEIAQLRLAKQQGQNVDAQLKNATARLAALQKEGTDAGKVAGRTMIKETVRNNYNTTRGANPITEGTLERVTDEILKGGQKTFDKYARIYEELKRKAEVMITTYGPGGVQNVNRTVDLKRLTDEERKRYILARAITEGETRIQKGTEMYAQAVTESTSAAREEFKGNRYALVGTSGTSGSRATKTEVTEKELSIQQQISKLETEAYTATEERRKEIAKLIQQLDKELEKQKAIRDELHGIRQETAEIVQGTNIQTQSGISEYLSLLKEQQGKAQYGSAEYNALNAQIVDVNTLNNLMKESVRAGVDSGIFDAADELGRDFWTRAMEGGVENIDWQSIVDKINEKRKEAGLDAIKLDFVTGNVSIDKGKESEVKQTTEKHENQIGKVVSGMTSITNSLQHIGVEIPEGFNKVINIMNIIQTILTTVGSFGSAGSFLSGIPLIGGFFSLFGLANGGVVHAANGFSGIVPGNLMSGDQIPALLNSGEVVLNRAQAGVLASDMRQGSIGYEGRTQAVIESDQIKLVLRNGAQARGMTLSDYLEI